jgi:hypothetical protein
MESRACVSCEKELPISMYDCSGTKNDKIYYRSKCKSCRLDDKHRRDENKKNAEKVVITIKQCDICNSTKNCDEFSRESKSIDGYKSCCKSCYKIIRWRNKDKASIISTLEEKLCSTCNIVKNIALFKSNKKSKDGYFYKCNDCWKPREWNAEKEKISQRKYVETHRDKVREKYRLQGLKINRRVRQSLNCRISQMLKQHSLAKNNRTLQYVGCDFHFLKGWFEFQFQENMNWDNYGKWEIDHVIPCSSFNLENIDEQLVCFKWSNLSPCWKSDNIKKGNKIIDSIIQQHKNKVDKFLLINPLPTPPGNRAEGTE